MADLPENILREMLGDTLVDAVMAARTTTGDDTILVKIGENPNGDGEPYPADFVPGLVSIHRDGHDTVFGLSHRDAEDQLAAIS